MLPLYPDLFRQEPTYSRRPEGMQAAENAVWQLFRIANLGALKSLYFNVHCGDVPGLTDQTPPAENRLRSAVWSKRCDVIAEAYNEVWLIEVKTQVRPSAVGQILTYVPLLKTRNPAWDNPRPLLIAGTFDPDALALCGRLGFECIGPPFTRLAPRRTI